MNTLPIFNNPIESALRSLILLVEVYPDGLDLQKLVYLDYLLVHSSDAGGPESLHPPTPRREGEVIVRRGLIEQGLNLLLVRGLVDRRVTKNGFDFAALDSAGGFISSLSTNYSQELRNRAQWVAASFRQRDVEWLSVFFKQNLGQWGGEFALSSAGLEDEA
jgi:hypothetical protein